MPRVKRLILPVYLGAGLLYLFLPVLVVILFSFNDNQGRFNVRWQGFTLRHWLDPFRVEEIPQSLLEHHLGAGELGDRNSHRNLDCACLDSLSLQREIADQHLVVLPHGHA